MTASDRSTGGTHRQRTFAGPTREAGWASAVGVGARSSVAVDPRRLYPKKAISSEVRLKQQLTSQRGPKVDQQWEDISLTALAHRLHEGYRRCDLVGRSSNQVDVSERLFHLLRVVDSTFLGRLLAPSSRRYADSNTRSVFVVEPPIARTID